MYRYHCMSVIFLGWGSVTCLQYKSHNDCYMLKKKTKRESFKTCCNYLCTQIAPISFVLFWFALCVLCHFVWLEFVLYCLPGN